jgi:L-fuculose-phosphate aldolase
VTLATAQSLREQVACACRILALEGYADLTLGHVSGRAPGTGTVYIKRRGVALDEAEPDDVISFELDDEGALDSPEMHLEAVLHTEVYRARPDVGAIVHGHPPYATALAATGARLELLTHDAVLFVDGVAAYDETAELITEPEQGQAVARALGDLNAVLLRNHGVLAVGRDIAWAVLVACTLERAVRLQAIASTLGELRPIDEELARRMYPAKYHDGLVEEYWQAWLRKLRRNTDDSSSGS